MTFGSESRVYVVLLYVSKHVEGRGRTALSLYLSDGGNSYAAQSNRERLGNRPVGSSLTY